MPVEAPHVLVIAGPNGSGKSSLTGILQQSDPGFPSRYVNADEIAVDLRSTVANAEQVAFHQARRIRTQLREAGVSFAYETVFSHPSGLVDLQHLRDAGYEVRLVVVTTDDPEINVRRVARRVAMGGHGIPPDKIRSRYHRFHRFLPVAAELAHQTSVYDSTDEISPCLQVFAGKVEPGAPPPLYLEDCLVAKLAQRSDDRRALLQLIGNDAQTIQPDLGSGTYGGQIAQVLPTAFLQIAHDHSVLIHDRALFDHDVQPSGDAHIRYEQGYGRVEFPGTPPGS